LFTRCRRLSERAVHFEKLKDKSSMHMLRKDLLIEILVKRNHPEAELEYHNNLIRMMSTS
jgi:hypothetical protein